MNALTNQNTMLQKRLSAEQDNSNSNLTEADTRVEHMSSSLKQLEMERDQLMNQLDQERDMHSEVKEKFSNLQMELATQGNYCDYLYISLIIWAQRAYPII